MIMCTRLLNHSNNVAIVMVEGEAEGIDEATFCEAVMMGMSSVRIYVTAFVKTCIVHTSSFSTLVSHEIYWNDG